jgi:hypothetical protein
MSNIVMTKGQETVEKKTERPLSGICLVMQRKTTNH